MMRRGCSVLLIHFHTLSNTVARVPGKGPRNRDAADPIPAPLAADPCAVWRTATKGPPDRSGQAARGHLSPADAAHCRAARPSVAGTCACHRRSDRPGRVSNDRERHEHRRGDHDGGVEAAGRHGQGRDRRRCRAARHLSDLDHPRSGLLPLFTPRHPATRVRREEVEQAERRLPVGEMVGDAVAAAAVEDFRFPMLEYSAGHGVRDRH